MKGETNDSNFRTEKPRLIKYYFQVTFPHYSVFPHLKENVCHLKHCQKNPKISVSLKRLFGSWGNAH